MRISHPGIIGGEQSAVDRKKHRMPVPRENSHPSLPNNAVDEHSLDLKRESPGSSINFSLSDYYRLLMLI